MKMYNANVEVDVRADQIADDVVDAMMGQLATFHVALGTSPRGWIEVRISLPAENLAQACATAAVVVESAAGAAAIACEVMAEEEYAARQGFSAEPDIVASSEAAAILGVSTERVRQLAAAGQLQEIPTAGRGKVFSRSSVEALAAKDRPGGRPRKAGG